MVVAGAGGFVGRHLVTALATAGHRVVALHRAELTARAFPPNLRPAAVVDLAGIAHRRAGLAAHRRVSVDLARALAGWSWQAGARFIYISSIAAVSARRASQPLDEDACGRPARAYGRARREAEEALSAAAAVVPGRILTVFRLPAVYGPGCAGNPERLRRHLASGWPLPAAETNRRSLLAVDSLVSALMLAATDSLPGLWHLADREPCSTADMARAIAGGLGLRPRLWPLPEVLAVGPLAALAGSLVVDADRFTAATGWRGADTATALAAWARSSR